MTLRLQAIRSDHVPVFDIQKSNRFRSERQCEHRLALLHKCVFGTCPTVLDRSLHVTWEKKNEGRELI